MRTIVCLLALLAAWPLAAADYKVGERLPASAEKNEGYQPVMWDDLMPKDWDPMAAFKGIDLNRLSDQDPKAAELLAKARAAWDVAPVVPAMNNKRIRMPGFAIPLERKGDLVTEFLLVPYFGACVHVPPPPSNQVVYVVSRQPIKDLRTMDTLWVSGLLTLQGGDSGMGTYAYRLQAERVTPYQMNKEKKQ